VESSPFGKVTQVQWLPHVRSFNITVDQGAWAGEPISVFFPPESGIHHDPLASPDDPDKFLDTLFASPQYLPELGSLDAGIEVLPLTRMPSKAGESGGGVCVGGGEEE
jgi:hypothetical protein